MLVESQFLATLQPPQGGVWPVDLAGEANSLLLLCVNVLQRNNNPETFLCREKPPEEIRNKQFANSQSFTHVTHSLTFDREVAGALGVLSSVIGHTDTEVGFISLLSVFNP